MANRNGSTEAQRNHIAGLVRGKDQQEIADILAPAFAMNSNRNYSPGMETLNQALRRITKRAASQAIDILKEG